MKYSDYFFELILFIAFGISIGNNLAIIQYDVKKVGPDYNPYLWLILSIVLVIIGTIVSYRLKIKKAIEHEKIKSFNEGWSKGMDAGYKAGCEFSKVETN